MSRRTAALTLLLAVAASALRADDPRLYEAVATQQALVEKSPEDAELHNDLGNLLALVDRTQEAEEAYRTAQQLDSELVAPRFNLGLLLHETGRPTKARREFEKLLKIDPDHAWAHYQLGVLNVLQGKRETAIKSYARALRLDPRLTDPAYNPHILENTLAASATLRAYADLSSVDLVPRAYDEPRRIAGLLIPMLPPRNPMATEASETEGRTLNGNELGPEAADSPEPTPSQRKRPGRKPKTR